MTSRSVALIVALAAIALTLAQDVRPGLDLYHTWQYAAALTLAMIVMAAYAWGARAGADGRAGRFVALALAGALTVAGAGLVAGLIGPDTLTVTGSPGTVTPIPDLGLAAFFGPADPPTLARGDAPVTLRERGAEAASVPSGGGRLYRGTSIFYLNERPAAYIVARDAHGDRLTVTQPAGAAFLSPVLLFPQNQALRDKTYPLDTFAAPGLHRIVRALYFSADDAQTFNHLGTRQPALVLAVNDDAGKSVGLTIARSGQAVAVGDLHITATLGTYPQLVIAAAPYPVLLGLGLLVFAAGLVAAAVRRSGAEPRAQAPPAADAVPAEFRRGSASRAPPN